MEQVIRCRHNTMEADSLKSFAAIRNGNKNRNSRDIYFVRILGWNPQLGKQIRDTEAGLAEQMRNGKLFYRRTGALPKLLSEEDTQIYTEYYEHWKASHYQSMQIKACSAGRTDGKLAEQLGTACRELAQLYRGRKKAVTESIVKNFIVKLLYWSDFVFDGMDRWRERGCIKIAADNIVKEQEYLFYYFLAQIGCDVLLLQSREDVQGEENKTLSEAVRAGEFTEHVENPQQESAQGQERIVVKIPQRRHGRNRQPDLQNRNPAGIQGNPAFGIRDRAPGCQALDSQDRAPGCQASGIRDRVQNPQSRQDPQSRWDSKPEKSFEELAALASSIVMITVHDREGKVISTGSGIMAGRGGYILTNDHVARGGYSYSVRIENDSEVYCTDELIKYNPVLDLALLRIKRQLDPLPVYAGTRQLVRGQTVVAIGSPLGLFNSVSNGIISGFRKIDGVDMIQFTAPISSGSSGGAVLNMQGEVIGISTAGFDRGQNINLAVGYENIRLFIQGF